MVSRGWSAVLEENDLRSEKNGMIWEMMKATTQVQTAIQVSAVPLCLRHFPYHWYSRRIPAHEAQPMIVCSFLCFESLKMRKKTRRAETDEYRTPRKMRVGIMKEKETFLKTGSSEPNAGDVM